MKIKSTRFGEIEVAHNKIITFTLGIPGFEDLKRYFLIDYKEPIQWLHAVDDPDVAFIVTNPFLLFPDYFVNIRDDAETLLDIKDPGDMAILVILTVAGDRVTANLKAPLIMNAANFTAVQIILDDERYVFKTPMPSMPHKAASV